MEAEESYFAGRRRGRRGRGARGKIPVFGIFERNGRVSVEVVPDVSAKTLLQITVKKVQSGSLIYTDMFKGYDGLVVYGFRHERIDKTKRFANGRVSLNGIQAFWAYTKGRILQYHGLSPEYFPLYLKELEFRYNHREVDLYENTSRSSWKCYIIPYPMKVS